MSDITQAIAAHHRELTDRLSAEVANVEDARSNGEGLVAFLRDELLPHAAGEETHLYPRVDRLIKQHGDATATMRVDHEEIVRLTEEIERVAGELTAAQTTTERDERRRSLSRLGLQLEAILALHARKEEVVYL
ncbi:MAG TPA: hemerythrin domain-containing protein, partial [Ktedonobacterales bacterium]|nr:hemerythrin domain-containing protein [Ktedonobacterales bacterium]